MITEKECTQCGEVKPFDAYTKNRDGKYGLMAACKACRREHNNKWKAANPDKVKAWRDRYRAKASAKLKEAEYKARWEADNPDRVAFYSQRTRSQSRGILFMFTFDEWREWWGGDYEKRGGRSADDLVMARYNDSGPYVSWNCYKTTLADNVSGPRQTPWHNFRFERLNVSEGGA